MTKTFPVTAHCIVRNEDRFVGYAINSVLDYVEKILVYDTGSVDSTKKIIRDIGSRKISFSEKGKVTPQELVKLRREQIKETSTDFIMVLDGDEVWPQRSLETLLAKMREMPEEKLALFCRSRNCVGDIYHYQPESAGRYRLAGKTGHFNIRVYRNTPDLGVEGVYPLEAYTYGGVPINIMPEKLEFADAWYLHATHLKRSSISSNPKFKYELGIPIKDDDIPGVFFDYKPEGIRPPTERASLTYLLRASLETPLKNLKRSWISR